MRTPSTGTSQAVDRLRDVLPGLGAPVYRDDPAGDVSAPTRLGGPLRDRRDVAALPGAAVRGRGPRRPRHVPPGHQMGHLRRQEPGGHAQAA